MSFPVYEKGDVCSAVEEAVFSATASACGAVVAYFLDSFVVISVLEHGAVVAGEDNHGVVEDTLFLKMVDKLSDTPVGLNYSVAAGAHGGGAGKAFVGSARHVGLMQTVVEEEGRVGMCGDVVFHLSYEIVGHVFVAPACCCPRPS